MMLSKSSLEYLHGLTARERHALVEVKDGSGRWLVYNDKDRNYSPIERFVKRDRRVSNVESLAAMVIEEARRAGVGGSADRDVGDQMTVIFDAQGAAFHLDDRDGRAVFRYQRTLSPQWQILDAAAGRPMGHVEFVRLLQSLKPSIENAPRVARRSFTTSRPRCCPRCARSARRACCSSRSSCPSAAWSSSRRWPTSSRGSRTRRRSSRGSTCWRRTSVSVFRLRAEKLGNHVHVGVFTAPASDRTFAKSGSLILNTGEWQELGAAMLLAEKQMGLVLPGRFVVQIEGYLAKDEAA